MSDSVIKTKGLSKQYRLGSTGSHTLSEDLNRFLAKLKGKEDPYLKIGTENKRDQKAISDYVWSLKNIDLDIKRGEAVGILGRNGAGKSTLLKILSRVTKPTVGKVYIKGRIASLLEVGTGFHADLTGRENIYMNGAILGMSSREITSKMDEIIDFSGVSAYIDTPVKRYSSGMYVRLAFAVAANLDPEILIVDEVLAVGDAEFQKKCLGKMQDVNSKDGRTVLFVSHNILSISALCNKGVLLSNGQLQASGHIDDIVNVYTNSGANMNLVQKWENNETAPGNNTFKLKRFEVIPEFKNEAITIKDSFRIEIDFIALQDSNCINLSIHLNTLAGDCIFNIVTDAINIKEGLFSGVAEIPGDLLNDGMYQLSVMVVIDRSTVLFYHKEGPIFAIEETKRLDTAWFGKWNGAVRPSFIPFKLNQ